MNGRICQHNPAPISTMIMGYNDNMQTRKAIDGHLEQIAYLNAKIGIDSTSLEKELIKLDIVIHEKKIMALDFDYWESVFKVD